MFQLNTDLTRGLDLITSRHQELTDKVQNKESLTKVSVNDVYHAEKNTQQSFTFFYRSVQTNVEVALEAKQQKLSQQLAEKQLEQQEHRAENAANNILSFIETQLGIDKEHGAEQPKLSSRLDAALAGFEQGYAEAKTILGDLELLTPELQQEIELTYDKVEQGLAQLRQTFLVDDVDVQEPSPVEPEVSTTNLEQAASSSNSSSFSFDVTTNEGDVVTIYAESNQQLLSYLQQQQSGSTSSSITAYASQTESLFNLRIDGDLNEQEHQAISELLTNVTDLASDFYLGDTQQAFEKAISLGYDSSQISEFSVNLTQVKNFTAYKAYQTDKPLFNANAIDQFKPLANFSNQLQQMLTQLNEQFEQPQKLIADVIPAVDNLLKPEGYPIWQQDFSGFAEQLLNTFEQLQRIAE